MFNVLPHCYGFRNTLFSIPAYDIYIYICMYNRIHIHVYMRACVCVYGPGSSVGIMTDYRLDGPGSNPGGVETFRPSRPALGPTQPPIK